MADSFQNEVPKARINLKLALHTGGAQKKIELPLKLLTVGDFSNGKENRPLSEREKINVNKNNFNSVLSEFNPEVNLTVPNTMAGDGSEESIKLNFCDIKDFEPEQVARQIPQLRAMLAMRNLLRDLKSNLLDTASARVRMSLDTIPEPLTRMKAQLTALAMEKQALLEDIAVGNTAHGERLAAIGEEEVAIILQLDERETRYGQELKLTEELLACRTDISRQGEIADLQMQLTAVQQNTPLLGLDVDARTVATVIADWTGVPLSSLMKDEQTELLSLEQNLGVRVVGQDSALNAIAQRLRASKTGLAPENGPQGVFLLVGPSGTGKTETALALADELFGGEKSLITINLSEYQEPHTVSQLKGSPPGYVGYGQGGILTEAVRKRPYSVVLLDEVEKAHRDVMNLFYQVFDRGFMRDGEGREIDFRNTVILMTSNLGSDLIMQMLEEQPEATEPDLHELLRPVLRDHFQPALLARFQTVIYRPLAKAAMRTIVEMKLNQVSRRLNRHYGMTTHISESLYDALTAACLLPDTGARNVDSLLNQQILPVLSQQLLSHMAAGQKPHTLTLGWDEEEGIVLEFDRTEGVHA
ncbi:type VI secretion system contractile sheath small subunit [Enterobacter hormaechei]|uniref:type VI secretion system contractile sheath small subunit n=1 Tax=Enterobacter hormaechei TaxID=158836 RepID=UPI0034DCEFBA